MAKYKLPKVEELFEAGVHFGHQVRRWNPKMESYIYTQRSGIHIVDLQLTLENLKKSAEFLYEVASNGGQIIFVGTKRQASEIIAKDATRSGALYVNDRWLGGTITNFRVVKRNMDKLVDYMKKRNDGSFAKYTKKERLLLDREIEKLEKSVGGIVALKGKPAALFVIDTRREKTAIKEAKKSRIPVVGIVDTNCDPNSVDYVIPGNDDAIRSISMIVTVLADAVEAGYKAFADKSAEVVEVKEVEPLDDKLALKVSTTEAPHASEVIKTEPTDEITVEKSPTKRKNK